MTTIYVDKNTNRVIHTGERILPVESVLKIYEVEQVPVPEPRELHETVLYYNGKKFTVQYQLDPNLCHARINELSAQLFSTDYQVIKSAEYGALGIEAKYNMNELHTHRQALRDEINRIKTLIDENA